MEEKLPSVSDDAPTLGQVIIAAIIGLIAVPALLSDALASGASLPWLAPLLLVPVLWLVVAVVLVFWLIWLAPRFTVTVRSRLSAVPWHDPPRTRKEIPTFDPGLLAAVFVAAIEIPLAEAILRRPLVLTLGILASPLVVDAIVACIGLLVILAILVRLYAVSRPFIEASTWFALDALIPTSGSDATKDFYRMDVVWAEPQSNAGQRQSSDPAMPTLKGLSATTLSPDGTPTLPAFDVLATQKASSPAATVPAQLPLEATQPDPAFEHWTSVPDLTQPATGG